MYFHRSLFIEFLNFHYEKGFYIWPINLLWRTRGPKLWSFKERFTKRKVSFAKFYLKWARHTPEGQETPSFGQSPAQRSPASTIWRYFTNNCSNCFWSFSLKLVGSPPQGWLRLVWRWIRRPKKWKKNHVMKLFQAFFWQK